VSFRYCRSYAGRVQAVIFDWAGTTVDFGCCAPAGIPVITTATTSRVDRIDPASVLDRLIVMSDLLGLLFRRYRPAPSGSVGHGAR